MRFNVVNPERSDFDERAVSPAVEDPELRAHLARKYREMIDRGSILPTPIATKTHTSEELAEMGFVTVTL